VAAYQENFFTRGPSPLARVTFFGLVAVAVMIADHRFQALSAVRVAVSTVLTPIEQALVFPGKVARDIGAYFTAQDKLLAENKALSDQVLMLSAEGQRARLILSEQTQVAAINAANERFSRDGVVAEIIRDARNPFARRIIINRGLSSGIKAGAAVINGAGVVGQVTSVGANTAEVTLTTEKNQSVPVMIVRPAPAAAAPPKPTTTNTATLAAETTAPGTDIAALESAPITRARSGLRAVAVGGGREGTIELPFIPVAADIQVGDELVTSGIDGTYPAGLSVAKVTIVDKNPAFSFARIVAQPSTAPDHHRFVKVLTSTDAAYPQPDVATTDRAGPAKASQTKREAKLEARRALRDR
jgi:rod shape-determining protein MreC